MNTHSNANGNSTTTKFLIRTLLCVIAGLGWSSAAQAQQAPGVDVVMKFRPVQQGVEYEIPTAAEFSQCKVEVERSNIGSGWVVYGPQGQPLRRFVDTNKDNIVDQWRYYQNGLEVYRDIDTNANNKADQFRWLTTAGTRWGIDKDEDGKIDQWRRISAEEVTQQAIIAMATRDVAALQALMVNAEDVKTLGLESDLARRILARSSNLDAKLKQTLKNSSAFTPSTRWMRFDSSMLMPNIIPADSGKSSKDILVYENVMAIVMHGNETGFVQVGELVNVNNAWKLTQIPLPLEGSELQVTEGGILLQPSVQSLAGAGPSVSPVSEKMQKLLNDLQKLDQAVPGPTASRQEIGAFTQKRVQLFGQLAEAAASNADREQWLRQMIDGIAGGVQSEVLTNGVAQLDGLLKQFKSQTPNSSLIAYTEYRKLLCEYTQRLQAASAKATTSEDDSDTDQTQTWWIEQLETFVSTYPKADDTPDALLQLAITAELGGQNEVAGKWYSQLSTTYGSTPAGQRAKGAMHRMTIDGKPIAFQGTGLDGRAVNLSQYKGKVVLLNFWATWCQPCTEDLPQLIQLYNEYRGKGFEVLGVNLDTETTLIQPYLSEHKVPWQNVYEPGGMDQGAPALQFGIISVPTMFLIDQHGNVVSRTTAITELRKALGELLK